LNAALLSAKRSIEKRGQDGRFLISLATQDVSHK